MTYVVGTQVRASEPAVMRKNIAAMVRPKLTALGAKYVAGLETVAGGGPGEFTVGSRWDSLDTAMKALESFYADPEVIAAVAASPVQLLGRVIAVVEGEKGDNHGTYAPMVGATMSNPDRERFGAFIDDAHALVTASGCKGVRMLRIVTGEQVGAFGMFVYTDSIDAFFKAMSSTYTNDAMMGHFAALGLSIVSRTISLSH